MKEFFDVFLFAFKIVIAVALIICGTVGSIILGVLISPWFSFSYIVSIPLLIASISYLMDVCDSYTYF